MRNNVNLINLDRTEAAPLPPQASTRVVQTVKKKKK